MAFRMIKVDGEWIPQTYNPLEGKAQMTSRAATLADIGKLVRGVKLPGYSIDSTHNRVQGVLYNFLENGGAVIRCEGKDKLTIAYDVEVETQELLPKYRNMIPDDLDAGERHGQVSNDRVTWCDALILGHHRAAAFAWSASVLVKNIPTNQLYMYARIKVN